MSSFSKIFHPKNSKTGEPTSRTARWSTIDTGRNLDSDSSMNTNSAMAPDADTIYKTLRMVPEFDGNPNILTRFISICDQIVKTYISTAPGSELANACLINGILNKISGSAACTINSNGIPDNWQGIRTALINNFSDQRDETALYRDLSLATQGNKTPQEFYEHCQTLFSTIMTYVTLHESIPTTIEAKRALYKKVTMQAFVKGLKEPLGSRIRCMRPDTIEKALEYVQEELNVIYLQERSDFQKPSSSNKPDNHSSQPVSYMPSRFPNLPGPIPNWPSPVGLRPNQTPPQPFKFNPNMNQQQPQYRMPTRTQQMFRAMPQSYNAQGNVFRLPPRNIPPQNLGPKPMSGVQHFTPKPMLSGHDWRKSGNPPPNSYFKTREMNMNECASYDESYYPAEYCYEPEYYSNDFNYSNYDSYAALECNYEPINNYSITDNNVECENEPRPGPSHSSPSSSQDFRKESHVKRPT